MSISDSAPISPSGGGFDSGAAAFHLFAHARREGWRPLAGIGAIYFAFAIVASALMLWGIWPFMAMAMDPALQDAPPPPAFWAAFAQMMLVLFVYTVVYLFFYAMVDGALLRWLLGGRARMRLGREEGRLAVLSLLWTVFLFALFVPPWMLFVLFAGFAGAAAAGAGTGGAAIITGFLAVAAFFGMTALACWLAPRLAAAAALTVRDGRLRILGGWSATRGRFWPVLGAFFIVWVIYIAVSFGLQIVIQPLLFINMGGLNALQPGATAQQAGEALEVFLNPAVITIYAVYFLICFMLAFLFQAMLAGVNAYIAKSSGA